MSKGKGTQDLYDILGCKKQSTPQEIKRAYHTKAKEYHPDLNPNLESTQKFNQISHAYEVLGNDLTRNVYNALGQNGLDMMSSGFSFSQTTNYSSDGKFESQRTNIFTTNGKSGTQQSNVYTNSGNTYSSQNTARTFSPVTGKRKQVPITKTFECDLEDMYYGRTKRVKIKKKVLKPDGTQTPEEKILAFKLTPNLMEGSLITFANEGDQSLDFVPSDIIFKLHFKDHSRFLLQDKDLVIYYNISEQMGKYVWQTVDVIIKTIDERVLKITLPGSVNVGDETVIANEGMPSLNGRGNLIIKFV